MIIRIVDPKGRIETRSSVDYWYLETLSAFLWRFAHQYDWPEIWICDED